MRRTTDPLTIYVKESSLILVQIQFVRPQLGQTEDQPHMRQVTAISSLNLNYYSRDELNSDSQILSLPLSRSSRQESVRQGEFDLCQSQQFPIFIDLRATNLPCARSIGKSVYSQKTRESPLIGNINPTKDGFFGLLLEAGRKERFSCLPLLVRQA